MKQKAGKNEVCFTVRLNLDKPAEKKAWDALHEVNGLSYRQQVIRALNRENDPAENLRQIVREELQAALGNLQVTDLNAITNHTPVSAHDPESETDAAGKEESLRMSEDFLSALGF